MQKGKILFFNQKNGAGKLIAKDGKKYDFSADVWSDFENMPSSGLMVDFENRGTKVLLLKASQKSVASSKEIQKSQSRDKKEESKEKKSSDGSSNIKLENSVVDCVNYYFEEYLEVLQKNQKLLGDEKSLDYFKMRRFLLTAYNNLKQLDRTIQNDKFKEIESEIKFLEKIYLSLKKLLAMPKEVAFDTIFLQNQSDYRRFKEIGADLKKRLDRASALEKILNAQIKQKESTLFDLNSGDENYNELANRLKPIKKRYADTIYEISVIKKRLSLLFSSITGFKNRYYEPFCDLFEQNLKYYKTKIVKIMNVKAYEFDYTLWSNAKESPLIRKFFADCDIDGTYSSKTFLKYFLKSLDKEKLTQENRDLQELLNYLESSYTKRIIVLTKDSDSGALIKVAIENLDKDISVTSSTSPVDVVAMAKTKYYDLVIFDFNLKLMNGFEFVKMHQKNITKSGDFCVIYGEDEAKFMIGIENLGIKYSLKRPVNEKELREKLKLVL